MHLVFDIFQGIGVAAAIGIRPFLPVLAVGALAAASAQIHFSHTDYSFLQGWGFLLGAAIAAIILVAAELRIGADRLERREAVTAFGVISIVLGALVFAASLARGHYTAWPGLIGGALCAVVGIAASRPLFARVRARLDAGAANALSVYAEAAAVLLAVLSVLVPPIGLIGLLLLLWLIVTGRRRADQKYAGLRILR